MSGALEAYESSRRSRGLTKDTLDTTRYRIEALFGEDALGRMLEDLSPARAAQMLTDYADRGGPREIIPTSETQRSVLKEAQRFGRWCTDQCWIRADPFAALEVKGPRSAGKEQLTIDEVRKLDSAALSAAGAGDHSAIAVLMALYFAIRATEIATRTARDIDDDGRVLRVQRLKKRGRVVIDTFPIPEVLRPHMARLAADGGRLFPGRNRHWVAYHTRRLCAAAEVPEVGPHAVRGSIASGLRRDGVPAEVIAVILGHDEIAVTNRHYVTSSATAEGETRERLEVIQGGRR